MIRHIFFSGLRTAGKAFGKEALRTGGNQIKLTKTKKAFYLLSNRADTKTTFKFQEVLLYVKRFRPAPSILASHNKALLALPLTTKYSPY